MFTFGEVRVILFFFSADKKQGMGSMSDMFKWKSPIRHISTLNLPLAIN